jgi:hypothetical protein
MLTFFALSSYRCRDTDQFERPNWSFFLCHQADGGIESMETMLILLTTLPIPVLITVAVGCLTLLIVALLLVALIPETAERIVLVLNALQCLCTCREVNRINNSSSSINTSRNVVSIAELEQKITTQE